MKLSDWINQEHINNAEHYNQELNKSKEGYFYIDNFLIKEKVKLLRNALIEHGNKEEVYGVYSNSALVSLEDWEKTNEKDKFYTHLKVTGPKPGSEMSKDYLNHVKWSLFLSSQVLADWISQVCGLSANFQNFESNIFTDNHFLKKHSDDDNNDRVFCCVLYLSKDWKPEYGGNFLYYDKGKPKGKIAPIENRLMFFVPNKTSIHAIEPLQVEKESWLRISYSIWFNRKV